MKVEIITIGNELLLGYTIDTNSAFLSRELANIGVEVVRHMSVGDLRDDIITHVREALARTGAVITSGGLGPTSDDISVASVAAAFGRELREDPAVIAHIENLFRSRGYPATLNESNRRQAQIPRGAEVLMNRHGTAPGIWLGDAEMDGWIAMLPGVPRELKGLFADEVRPRIMKRITTHNVVASRTLRTTGIAESALAELIRTSGIHIPDLAYLPHASGVDLRVTVRNMNAGDAERLLSEEIAKLRSVAGDKAYGQDDTDLAEVVLGMARAKSRRIAVAESCTGGLLGGRLSAVPGASDVFAGGVIAYENEAKEKLLGVPRELIQSEGAVSEAVARAMASGVCGVLGTDIGVSITGIAGPTGGSDRKPVGTVWCCAEVAGSQRAAVRVLPGDRNEIRERATQMALDLLRLSSG